MARPVQPAVNGTEERLDALLQLTEEILAELKKSNTPPVISNQVEIREPSTLSAKFRRGR